MSVRVMFIISGFNRGGSEERLVDVLNGLNRSMFQPVLCVLHTGCLLKELKDDVKIYHEMAAEWAGALAVLSKLINIMKAEKPTIVFVIERSAAGFYGRLAALIARIPIIILSEHIGRYSIFKYPKRRLLHILNLVLDPITDAFIAISYSQREFLRDLGLPIDKITVINNGVDINRFRSGDGVCEASRQQLGLHPNDPIIGMVANFLPVKRHDVLLQAVVEIKKNYPNLKCLLIGDGDLRSNIEKIAHELGLSETILFLGTRPDVQNILPALDVFVLTSDSESFSNVIIEAMAAGRPLVSTNCGGPAEIIVDKETGFLAPRGDHLVVAEKIIFLLKNPDIANRMGQAGRNQVVKNFSLVQMITARETLFIKLLEQKKIL